MHRILAQSGYNCRLSQLNETSNGGQPQQAAVERHQYWMLPTTSAAFVRNASSDHVVLLVPANLEAVLTAYQNIKRLAQRNTPEIAVILVGAPDQNSAWHYFRKLAMGAMRYLDIPLLNLGYLPDQLPSQGGSVQEQPDNYLAPIIDRLLRSEFYTEYPAQKFVQRQR